MLVFVSWSGATSQQVALELHGWLPVVLQNVDPYVTPADVEKGARWQHDISAKLAGCNFGVLCMTQDNLAAPWILFEAGALSKVENARVATILFGVAPSSLPGPLSQFQATKFDKDEMLQLVQDMNAALPDEQRRRDDVLLRSFNMAWPELETKIKLILESAAAAPAPPALTAAERMESALKSLEELLVLSRQNSNLLANPDRLAELIAIHVTRTLYGPLDPAISAETPAWITSGNALGATTNAARVRALVRARIAAGLNTTTPNATTPNVTGAPSPPQSAPPGAPSADSSDELPE